MEEYCAPHAPSGAWWQTIVRAARRAAGPQPGEGPQHLNNVVVVLDGARRSRERADPITVLRWWHALRSGRLSVVEEFDSHGRRYVVALALSLELPRLAPRERRVATLVGQGLSNKVIASEMRVTTSTVATLLRRAARKLGVATRVELVQLMASAQLVEGRASKGVQRN